MKTLQRKVSIGLAVYNGENYLQKSLTRPLRQDFEDFEMIISDNASTDGTQKTCRACAQKDRRIHYFRNERNIGLAATHNRTFAFSSNLVRLGVLPAENLRRAIPHLQNNTF
jgi:glycosyltransferase involved in cell wall biosynthesis